MLVPYPPPTLPTMILVSYKCTGARGNHTGRSVVADHVPCVHVGVHGSSSAEFGVTAERGGVLPDKLGEVAPVLEVGHIRSRLAVVRGQELVDLAVVPHVVACHADGASSTQSSSVVRTSPHSNVLAVFAGALVPVEH